MSEADRTLRRIYLFGAAVLILAAVAAGVAVVQRNQRARQAAAEASLYTYCTTRETALECQRATIERYRPLYVTCYDLVKDRPLAYWRTCLQDQGIIP